MPSPTAFAALLVILGLQSGPVQCLSGSSHGGAGKTPEHRRQQEAARANKIDALYSRSVPLSAAAAKALEGLSSKGDTYSSEDFSEAHADFKRRHNAVLVALARHCQREGSFAPLFYLDGADGGTTSVLRSAGFRTEELFVANPFPATREALSSSPHSLSPSQLFDTRAEHALRSESLVSVPFCAYYLDVCHGSPEPLIDMVDAIFSTRSTLDASFAIGFSLASAEPKGRSLSDREQAVTRAVAQQCRRQNYVLAHVGDEPERFGVDPTTDKREGPTLTTWLCCEWRTRGWPRAERAS